MNGELKFQGSLKAKKRNRIFNFRLPFGRLLFTRDKGEALHGGKWFNSQLSAEVVRSNGNVEYYDLGSGLVTTSGVNYMASQLSVQAVPSIIYHDSGTGATAAAIGDTALQIPIVNTTVAVAVTATGSQVVTPAAMTNIAVNSVLGIDSGANYELVTVTAVTGTTFTANFTRTHLANFTVVSGRATGTQSVASNVFTTRATLTYQGTFAITEWGLYVAPGGPATLWDHRIFAAINVSATDQITFTYNLTLPAGG